MTRTGVVIFDSAACAILLAAVSAAALLRAPAELLATTPRQTVQTHQLESLCKSVTIGAKIERVDVERTRHVIEANEVVYLRCTERSLSYEIYVARWAAGNEHCWQAAEHPPDLCWPGTGWHCLDAQSNITVGDIGPVEWRRFVRPDAPSQEVIFWCVNGTNLIALGQRSSVAVTPKANNTPLTVGSLINNSGFLNFWRGRELLNPGPTGRLTVPSPHDVYFVRVNSSDGLGKALRTESWLLQMAWLNARGILPRAAEERRNRHQK